MLTYIELVTFFACKNLIIFFWCQYIELRFKSRYLRKMTSALYCISNISYLGLCLYAPTLALDAVTPLSLWVYIPLLGTIVTLYSSMVRILIYNYKIKCNANFYLLVGSATSKCKLLDNLVIIQLSNTTVPASSSEKYFINIINIFSMNYDNKLLIWCLLLFFFLKC